MDIKERREEKKRPSALDRGKGRLKARGFEPLQENPMRKLTDLFNQEETMKFLESNVKVRLMKIERH